VWLIGNPPQKNLAGKASLTFGPIDSVSIRGMNEVLTYAIAAALAMLTAQSVWWFGAAISPL
jgi:hypothetical protein